jgi:hypothetical protein
MFHIKNNVFEIHLFIFAIQTAGLEMDINRKKYILVWIRIDAVENNSARNLHRQHKHKGPLMWFSSLSPSAPYLATPHLSLHKIDCKHIPSYFTFPIAGVHSYFVVSSFKCEGKNRCHDLIPNPHKNIETQTICASKCSCSNFREFSSKITFWITPTTVPPLFIDFSSQLYCALIWILKYLICILIFVKDMYSKSLLTIKIDWSINYLFLP